MVDHVMNNMDWSGSGEIPIHSPFEVLNVHIYQAYKSVSRPQCSTVEEEETVIVVNGTEQEKRELLVLSIEKVRTPDL